MNEVLLFSPIFSDELLESWAAGKWNDGYPVTDIAALSSLLLFEKHLRLKLESHLTELNVNPWVAFPC